MYQRYIMIDSEWIDGIYIGAEQLTNDSILGTLSYASVVASMNHRMSFCLVHDFSYIFDTEIGMNSNYSINQFCTSF